MGLIERLFGTRAPAEGEALYSVIVDRGRAPHWYLDGNVPDTIDGRFDMIAAILVLVLIRLESAAPEPSARLTERFIADMDAQLREEGVGDVGIGKRVGQMMSMLGGRLAAYRDGLASGDLAEALRRNLYRGGDVDPTAIAHVEGGLLSFRDALAARPIERVLAGDLP